MRRFVKVVKTHQSFPRVITFRAKRHILHEAKVYAIALKVFIPFAIN